MTITSEDLKKYAHLLVHLGVNLQPGQSLVIRSEPMQREFALLLAEVAYDAGAKFVAIEYNDMRLQSVRIHKSAQETLTYLPSYLEQMAIERRDDHWAAINIVGDEDPSLLARLDPNRLRLIQTTEYHAIMPWRA